MKENVLDVLMYLYEYYMADNPGQPLDADREALESRLVEAGFGSAEIGHAFGWLDALWQGRTLQAFSAEDAAHEGARPSMRIYTALEMERLDTDCRGFLLFLEGMGILSPANRELVIERVLALPGEEMGLKRFKWLILLVLFNQPGEEIAYAWMEELVYDDLTEYLH